MTGAMTPTTEPTPPLPTWARVVAVIRPIGLDAAVEALAPVAPSDLLVEQVRGYGRQKGHLEFYEEGGFQGGFLPKVRLEFRIEGARLAEALERVSQAVRTGRIGDGKIFVQAIEPGVAT
jgi:nitrogen regulatory protein PII